MTYPRNFAKLLASFKSAIHFTAALVILWYFYRIANGHLTLL